MFRSFFPDEYLDSAYVINFEKLYKEGYRGLLFDIDNTIVPHGAPADERAKKLFQRLRKIGFHYCFVSNNKKPRVEPFARAVEGDFVENAHKPAVKNYRKACQMIGTDPDRTIFVGDQLFTDIYGAKRAGIRTILVKPIHPKEEIQIVLKRYLEKIVHDYSDEDEIRDYLQKLLHKEAFDKRGLIYGMGHAIYSVSDPRAEVFKGYVEQLAREKGRMKDYQLYEAVERLAPQVIAEERKIYKGVSANVDFYSGFVYSMLDLPLELYTPMFAIARIVGWSAHRMEELINVDKIIRPAYKNVLPEATYVPLAER